MLGISNQTQCRFDLSYFKEKGPSPFIWQLHVFIKEFISLHSNRTKTRWTDRPWLPSASNISHLLAFFCPQSSQYNFTEILLLIITAIVSSLLVGERDFLIKKKKLTASIFYFHRNSHFFRDCDQSQAETQYHHPDRNSTIKPFSLYRVSNKYI